MFLGSAALGLTGLALPGCATTSSRPVTQTGCLPPVDVSADRIIRTLAGLRPYRASGFVVRAEALGDKRLVHNYGHGGAGITLSWGSSKLAVDLGLPGHRGPVAVLGAGVMGLSTARLMWVDTERRENPGLGRRDLERGAAGIDAGADRDHAVDAGLARAGEQHLGRLLAPVEVRVGVDHATAVSSSTRGKRGSAGSIPSAATVQP